MVMSGDKVYGGSRHINFNTSNSVFLPVGSQSLIVVDSATNGGPYYLYLPSVLGFVDTGIKYFTIVNESAQTINVRFLGQSIGQLVALSVSFTARIHRRSLGTDAASWLAVVYRHNTSNPI